MKNALRKRSRLLGLVACVMTAAASASTAQAQSSDALLDALVKKGVLTEQESEDIKADLYVEQKEKFGNDVRFFWKDGLNFQSIDGKTFTGKLGGRIQWDTAWLHENDDLHDTLGAQDSQTEFRRARISLEGDINGGISTFYKFELDFAGAEVAFKDVYLGVNELPGVGSFTAGHMKEPMGLEVITSSRHITFIERATTMEAFAPERNTGLKIGDTFAQERVSWSVGGFTDVDDTADGALDDDWAITGRMTGLPVYDVETKGRTLVHLGLSGRYATPQDDEGRFRSRPEVHVADRFADTGAMLPAEEYFQIGLEAAGVFGPFSVQGELINTWVDSGVGGDDPTLWGFYVFGSYFITGENRAYKTTSAAFDRVRPKKNFSLREGGLGAWEVAVRYSFLDLNDSGVDGGELRDITGGVNWYMNPNMKVMLNYVFADLEDRIDAGSDVEGQMHSFLTRFQVDF